MTIGYDTGENTVMKAHFESKHVPVHVLLITLVRQK